MVNVTLARNIKALREAKGYSQEELGSMVGVKRAAIQKYEKGTVENISIQMIQKLAVALDSVPDILLGWASHTPEEYQAKVIKGVAYFYGEPATNLLTSYSKLSDDGKAKVVQYADDLTRSWVNSPDF